LIDVASIRLPAVFGEKRALRSDKTHTDGSNLDAYDLEQYDNDTVFYDVFFDVGNRFLYTVGPPFLNLQNKFLPITCRINNERERFNLQIEEYFASKIAIGRISLKGLVLHNENTVEIDFNGCFQWKGVVELNSHETAPLMLTTIQKDNRVRWITEWIEFYRRNYGVGQTIIYDNGSGNIDELKTLSGCGLEIVSWPYKYGPIRSHDNQFCQLGSLNHCRLKFGSNNIIMNFDIDELLHIDGAVIRKYIKKYNLILFNGHRVPFIKPASEDYSYADFSFRDRETQEGGRKYLYRPDRIIANNVHSALVKRHAANLYRRLELKYYRLSGAEGKGLFRRLFLYLISAILRLKIVPVSEAHFFHYTGITNNWKARYWNRMEETVLSDSLIKFDVLEG